MSGEARVPFVKCHKSPIDFPLLDLMLLNIEKHDAILCGKTAKKGNSNMMKTPNFFQKSAILSENLDKIQNAW